MKYRDRALVITRSGTQPSAFLAVRLPFKKSETDGLCCRTTDAIAVARPFGSLRTECASPAESLGAARRMMRERVTRLQGEIVAVQLGSVRSPMKVATC